MATSEAAFPRTGTDATDATVVRKPATRPRTSPKTRPAKAPISISSTTDLTAARATIARMRDEASARARPAVKAGAAPIRVMANMVKTLESDLRARDIPAALIASEVVNRTIGDVDLRRVSPDDDGPEYVSLADDMGLALPGEVIGGRTSTGDTYRWLHRRMLDFERQLLARGFDLRMYDLSGTGNPILREMLSARFERQWGYTIPPAQIHLSLGALDGLDKFFRGLSVIQRQNGIEHTAVMFPAPSFNVPEWQAHSLGLRIHRLYTRPEDHFKITPAMLQTALDEASDIRALYLTVSNNPTAFTYSPAELTALFDTLLASDRDVLLVTDLAYIGTGDPAEDRARMAAFNRPGVFERTVFVNSFSKTHSLTGDRCGWVGFGSPELAALCGPGWTNTVASLPAEWQLRYMAYIQLFDERPTIDARMRALYTHRRARLVRQLQRLNEQYDLFARVNLDDGGTVYNWSQLKPGEDVFTLFGKTGIAGVPGGGFGYSDDFVRLSVGCIPIQAMQ
ncbi:MAG TPA: pyridoxal phosphate-dependent aminotransferase [Ktedonobacterales bacterium]|nr:pyridoxal phosphate-dependent aminotransferase [Ktedonobacterales bacterium]